MASGIRKGLKRRWLGGRGDATVWQQCHSGFDAEIIQSEKNHGISKLGKGRKKTDVKLPSRKTTVSDLAAVEKDIDIDWESSSSNDSPPPLLSGDTVRGESLPGTCATQWVSTSLKPATSGGVPIPRESLKNDEADLPIDDNGSSQGKPAVGEFVAEEASISDYESSEAPSPSEEIAEEPAPPSPVVTPTQSPLISSYGQSTQDTSSKSPITSSQWVDKLKRGQQTTPDKHTNQVDRMEEKDSAKKNKKFRSCGLAERLKKLINREKSDIAFWNHQSSSQLAGSGTGCRLQLVSMHPAHSLVVARCHNLSESSDVNANTPDLPKDLVVLFNSKTVLDKGIQVGSAVQIYPPWQRLFLPGSSETVLLCTYYCKSIGQGCLEVTPRPVNTASPDTGAPRPVFRPSRLFSGDRTSPRSSLSVAQLPQNRSPATSLLGILATRGPSFEFTFSLRVLVLRVCKMVPARTDTERQKWRMLVQDRDRTVFEVQLTSDEGKDLKEWEKKVVDIDSLRILQRVTRVRNTSLFSMIESFTNSTSPIPVSDSAVKPKVNTAHPLQSISYIVSLEDPKTMSECQGDDGLQTFNYAAHKDLSLIDICQRREELCRANFQGLLLFSAPKNAANPLTSSSPLGAQLLFVTDPSLSGKSEKQDNTTKNYILVEKLESCPVNGASHNTDLQQYQGSLIHVEYVHVKTGDLLLDCYSSISIVRSEDTSEDCLPVYQPLTGDSAENTLVSVTGIMTGVDESTAYSWPICSACQSNRLTSDTSGDMLHCLSCDADVSSPITQINLQVLVTCPSLDETNSIKVKLKQGTVTRLFGEPSFEEPFDLKKILGKPYGPTACFVRKCDHTDAGQRNIELEEI